MNEDANQWADEEKKKPSITNQNEKVVLKVAKKGPKERLASDYKIFYPWFEACLSSSFTAQDKISQRLVTVFPLNIHDDSAINQCEKLLNLNHENVIQHTGYYRDEADHLNITADLPLMPDLDSKIDFHKFFKEGMPNITFIIS